MRSNRNKDDDDAVIQRSEKTFKTFLAELEKRGYTSINYQGQDGRRRIISIRDTIGDIDPDITFAPDSNRSSGWYRIYKDKLRIQIGHWAGGRRKQFPEPKKGFDWNKIIDYLEEYMKQRRTKLAAENCKRDNYQTARNAIERIEKTFGLKRIHFRTQESVVEPNINIGLNYLNPEEAEQVVKLLVEELPELFREK